MHICGGGEGQGIDEGWQMGDIYVIVLTIKNKVYKIYTPENNHV